MVVCDLIYELTTTFPQHETYGLSSQLRRAVVSVVSNIVEGEGRLTKGERRQALSNARGSLYEVRTQLEIARRRGYCESQAVERKLEALQRTLDGYIAFVRRPSQRPNVPTS
jgi:four helix bundle protein